MYCKLFTLLMVILPFSCKKSKSTELNTKETFVVVNREETMPVWVLGKPDSKYVLLAVHGGPGSDVLDFRNYQNGTAFKKIEDSCTVAYWQQRASGQSQGPDNTSYYNIAQYVEDLDKVVDEIKSRYPTKGIVLFGHSWGGTLTSTYLKDANRRAKITAWINGAGVHNGTILEQSSRIDLITEADIRIANNENLTYWQDVKSKAQNNNTSLGVINSLAYSCLDNISEVPIKVKNADFKFTQRAFRSNSTLFNEILATNNTGNLSTLTMPVLLIWGKYDFAVSKQLRNQLANTIPPAKVTNITLPISGHYMMFHEPALFANSVISFLRTL